MSSNNINRRPNTALRHIQQEDDDEDLARILAIDDDEKIARKLQGDYENGTGFDDFHRPRTARNGRNANQSNTSSSPDPIDAMDYRDNKTVPIRPQSSRKNRPPSASGDRKVNQPSANIQSPFPPSRRPEDAVKTPISGSSNYLKSSAANLMSQSPKSTSQSPESRKADQSSKISVKSFDNRKDAEARQVSEFSDDDLDSENSFAPSLTRSEAENDGHFDFSKELDALFAHISAYTPESILPKYYLAPFIPEFLPCIGDIDPILQIPPPDRINGNLTKDVIPDQVYLGLKYLDEPNIEQSDPAVVDYELRSFYVGQKMTSGKSESKVRSISLHGSGKEQGMKAIQSWLNNAKESFKTHVNDLEYQALEGDIEGLMQQWPSELDLALSKDDTMLLPEPDIDITLKEYVQLCCNIVDIPITESSNSGRNNAYIQSVAQMFMLYSGFKNSQHFGAANK